MSCYKVIKTGCLSVFSLGILISLGITGGWYWWQDAIAPVSANSGTSDPLTVTIPPGTAAQTVGEKLEAAGLIRSPLAWRVWLYRLRIQEQPSNLQAGTYQLSPSSSLPEIGQKILQGEVIETRFTIPEGWTLKQMAEHFQELGYFSQEAFLEATRQRIDRQSFPWLPQDLPHLEGFLYPDTYIIERDRATPEYIIKIMLDRFATVALPLYENQNSSYTLQEWVTLASIVEKEAVVPKERSRIAAVFAKRLEIGMRLGADPTVEYGLNIKQTEETPLTLKQVNTPSPYNTYLNTGLPPTPISSPGKPALRASLNPPDTDYLFFVARYDGTHVFSKTFAEHQAAQRRIQN